MRIATWNLNRRSVLPWAGAGGQPVGVWSGSGVSDWLADAMGLAVATAELPHRKQGLFAIDQIAVPVSCRVVTARRIKADELSDHDAYVVDVETGL